MEMSNTFRLQNDQAWAVRHYAIPAFFVFAFLFGGGGRNYPLVSALIEVGALALLAGGVARLDWTRRGAAFRAAFGLGLAWLCLILCQLIPLPANIWRALPGREPTVAVYDAIGWRDAWHALSLTPDATWLALIGGLPAIASFFLASSCSNDNVRLLLRVFVIIAVASAVLGIIQFGVGPDGPLYLFQTDHRGSGVGVFVNRNHQATYLLAAMIMAAVPGLFANRSGQGNMPRRGGVILILIALLLAAGVLATTSRTGIVLLPVAVILAACVAQVGGAASKILPRVLIATAIAGAAVLPTAIVQQTLNRFSTAADDERQQYWSNTLVAIDQSSPAGTGFGSFRSVYPTVEPLEQVTVQRVNNAHNDYLELALEGGAVGLVLLGLAVALIVLAVVFGMGKDASPARRSLCLACGGAFIILMAYSVVDYPLHMTSIMVLAAMLLGLLVRSEARVISGLSVAKTRGEWIVAALALLMSWQVVATGWAKHQIAAGDAMSATHWAPWMAQGWAALADEADIANRPMAAIVPARRALAIAPLDAGSVRALGLGLLAEGSTKEGAGLLLAGARLGWRDGLNQYWLVDHALKRSAYRIAVQRLDALLRQEKIPDLSLVRLGAIARVPEGQLALAGALSARPGWRQAFFNTLAYDDAPSVSAALAILRGVNSEGSPAAPYETALLRWKLAEIGDIAGVRAIWRASNGRTLVGDGGFDIDPEAALPVNAAPLSWHAPSPAGTYTLIAIPDMPWNGRALIVTTDGLARGTVLAQRLVLEAGRYQLAFVVRDQSGRHPALQWNVQCGQGDERRRTAPIALSWSKRRDSWEAGRGEFAVAPDCPVQDLQLQLPGGSSETSTIFLDDVAISRVAR